MYEIMPDLIYDLSQSEFDSYLTEYSRYLDEMPTKTWEEYAGTDSDCGNVGE